MSKIDSTVFLETDSKRNDALLYTAIFDEVQRLKICRNRKERQDIRRFILSGSQILKTNTGHSDISKIVLTDDSEKIFEIFKDETEKYNKSAHKATKGIE